MFIVELIYKKDLSEVEKYLESHRDFLDKYYEKGNFICSGRKKPRDGGIILLNAQNKEEVYTIIEEDPFFIEKIADYKIIEFDVPKYAPGFKIFVK